MKAGDLNIGVLSCCLLGIGSYWAWSASAMISATFWQDVDASLSHALWLANTLAHGSTLLLLGLLSVKTTPFGSKRAVYIGAPVLVVVGTIILYLLHSTSYFERLAVLGSLIAGIGTAGLLVMWAEAITRIGTVSTRRFVLAGSVVAGLLMVLLVVSLPFAFSFPFAVSLPILSAFCIKRALSLIKPSVCTDSDEPANKKEKRSVAIRLLLCCFIFAIPTGLFQNRYTSISVGSASEIWGMVFSCVLILVALVSLLDYFFDRRYGSSMFSKLIVPFIAGGLLVFPFFSAAIEMGAGIIILTGYHLFLVYIYADFSTVSTDLEIKPSRVFAFGTCVIDLGLVAGSLLVESVATLSSEWFTGVALGVAYLLMLVGILLFPKIVENFVHRTSDKKAVYSFQKAEIEDPFMHFKERCHAITGRYGLSSREEEVLSYLLRGRSLRSIASETFLSYNTVKTHVSHIYRKIDVHTRKELIDVFESTLL